MVAGVAPVRQGLWVVCGQFVRSAMVQAWLDVRSVVIRVALRAKSAMVAVMRKYAANAMVPDW